MKALAWTLFVGSLVTTMPPAFAAVMTGPIVNPANGHSYSLLSPNDWIRSELEAISLGGHLVTINDQAENDWVFSTFATYGGTARCLWIGLTDGGHEGTFTWMSGDPVSYANWERGQPDNGASAENWVHLLPPGHYAAGQWNDYQNLPSVSFPDVNLWNVPLNGVLEVPEPCAAVIALLGLGSLLLRRNITR